MTSPSIPTRTVRAGIDCDTQHGAVMPPLHLSSNYTFDGLDRPRPFDYTRSGNPTRSLLADALADLEGGASAVVTSTGMSAIATVLQLVPPGGLVVAAADCYGGSWRLLDAWARAGRFRLRFWDPASPADLVAALAEGPDLVWIETPSNPLLRLTDIAAVVARSGDALVVADNTFLSPVWQQPLALGADVVVHSTTKYLNGHSDVVGGAVIAREAKVGEQLAWWANAMGVTGAPFDSYLTLRGLRTLHARMPLHAENAVRIAHALEAHPAVSAVHYPGLASHPDRALAARQQSAFGAIVAFELDGGRETVARFLAGLEVFTLAESLGGVESLVAHPATMTHAAMSAEAREAAGIGEGLLRLSVGIEQCEDLLADLERGLALATPRRRDPDDASPASRAVARTRA